MSNIYMMHIIEEVDLYDEIDIDIDKTYNNWKRMLNAAYKRMHNKIPEGTSKKIRKAIRKAIEVGIGIAEELYDTQHEFCEGIDYNGMVENALEEVIGEMEVTDSEKSTIRCAVEVGIREAIKDNMVKGGRYY